MNSFFDKIYMTLANLPYIKRYHISEEWSEELELLMDRAGIGDVEYRPPTSCDSTIIYINGIQIWIGQVFYMTGYKKYEGENEKYQLVIPLRSTQKRLKEFPKLMAKLDDYRLINPS